MANLLNHKIVGSGPPIVFLHGLFGMLDNWFGFAKRLQENFTCILVDQRNHGRSFHAPKMDYQLMAEDLVRLLEDLGIYETAILGHSMGGKTAMQVALAYSEMVTHLIVVDIAPVMYPGNHDREFDAMRNLDLGQFSSRKNLRLELSERLDPGTADFLLKNISRENDAFSWRFGLEQIQANYDHIRLAPIAEYGEFLGPTSFIRGARSPYITAEHIPLIEALFPSAEISEIPDAGHWVHVDAPLELHSNIMSFLESH